MIEFIRIIIDFCTHIDKYLGILISSYGSLVYLILFIVVFCETGLIVFPFLPGDSLLFIAGAFAAKGDLNIVFILILLSLAAILGDTFNYSLGRKIGNNIYRLGKGKLINPSHIEKTKMFFDKHGGKAIIIARFIPIVRTFAPFVAGTGKMNYSKFLSYNIVGGLMWAFIFAFTGFFFGNLPFIQENFSLIIYGIVASSLLLPIITFIKNKAKK